MLDGDTQLKNNVPKAHRLDGEVIKEKRSK